MLKQPQITLATSSRQAGCIPKQSRVIQTRSSRTLHATTHITGVRQRQSPAVLYSRPQRRGSWPAGASTWANRLACTRLRAAAHTSEEEIIKRRDDDIARLLIPALLAVFLDPAMAVVDTAIVGQLGTVPLGAVGLSNLVFFFCTVFFSFLLVVTTPRVATAVAQDSLDEASIATAQALWVGLLCGTLLGALLWFAGPWLITSGFAADPGVANQAMQHFRIRGLAAPAAVILFVVNGAFRGFRDTKTPLVAGIAQNVVNLGLDLSLVLVAGWGVVGAAAAMTIAQYTGAASMIAMLILGKRLQPRHFMVLPTWREVGTMLQPGIPLAFCMASVMTSIVSATNLAAGMGAIVLAAHTIVKQTADFCLGLTGTFSTVAQTLVASSLGKNDKAEARAYLVRLLQLGLRFGGGLALALLVGSRLIPNLFSKDIEVIALAQRVIPLLAASLPLAPCATALEGTLLGALKVNWVGARTVASALLSVAFLQLSGNSGWGLLGIWMGIILLVVANFVGDAYRITRKDSPIAAVMDVQLSIDMFDEEVLPGVQTSGTADRTK